MDAMLSERLSVSRVYSIYSGREPGIDLEHLPLDTRVVNQMLQVVQAHTNIIKHEIYFDNFFTRYDLLSSLGEREIYVVLEQSEKTGQQDFPSLWRRLKPCPRNLAVALTTVVMARCLFANGMTTLWSMLRVITLLTSRFIKQIEE